MHSCNGGIHKIFELEVVKRPNDLAIKMLEREISYQDLNYNANHLAQHLLNSGVQFGDIIGVELSDTVELAISMLAILKCGAAYLPIDETNPISINKLYIETANVGLLISKCSSNQSYSNGLTIISTNNGALFQYRLEHFDSYQSAPDDKAYVMFTSGSTGKPKGVVVPHRAVVRLVKYSNYINIRPSDNILQFSKPSFDASTFEFWAPLLNGATLVPYSGNGLDPNVLKSDIKNNRVTVLWLTAALFHLMADKFIDALTPLNILLAGGDVLNPKYVNKIFDTLPDITFINGYGPTENTTFTCCHVMTSRNRPLKTVPIGQAISGTGVHILDDAMRPVERGQIGELIASGNGVALGYLNEEYNTDVFISNNDIAPGLLYRTGDLVKENVNGELEFVGRKDNQMKIRGFRVSLEDIGSTIVNLAYVSDAIVITNKFESDDQLLIAYIQSKADYVVDVKKVKADLKLVLPSYMIPDQFFFSKKLPINSNGKIDRKKILSIKNEQLME